MMFRRSALLSLSCACGVALSLGLGAGPDRVPTFDGGTLPSEGQGKLESDYNNRELKALIRDMEDGRIDAGKDQEAAIATLARWYTYRLTWQIDVQNKRGAINNLFVDLAAEFDRANRSENTQSFKQMFAKDLAKYDREVLQNHYPIARMNAARVLYHAAGTREPDIANLLIEVVQNPAHNEGTRYWAFKGLQEFLAPGGRMPPPAFKDKDRALVGRIALALLAYLDQKSPVPEGTPQDQVDGFRAVRREAIHALGLTQSPSVRDKGKLTGRTAQVLLRVVRQDGFVPEPRWDEQLEAAIGIGWLQDKLDPAYQPDYAVYNAAYGVLRLAVKYGDEARENPDRGWKYYSARLGEAFENLQRDITLTHRSDRELVAYVTDVAKQSLSILNLIGTKGNVNPGDFEQWLINHPPKSKTVYADAPDSSVKPGGDTGEK
jgi:hypothetical protein